MKKTCPACGVAALQPQVVDETIRYGEDTIVVSGVRIAVCESCGEEVVPESEARYNEVLFADAKRVHDGLLTSAEIVQWRNHFSLTQQQAASILGGGANAFSKYERGEVIQSSAMDKLLRVTRAFPAALEHLAKSAGIALSRPVTQQAYGEHVALGGFGARSYAQGSYGKVLVSDFNEMTTGYLVVDPARLMERYVMVEMGKEPEPLIRLGKPKSLKPKVFRPWRDEVKHG
jgi:HTH-type transcriptional regulator/antitoxin MqsA